MLVFIYFELAECGDFGGADEGEVVGPEEYDAPGVFVQTLGGNGGKVIFGLVCLNLGELAGNNAGQLVGGELVVNG